MDNQMTTLQMGQKFKRTPAGEIPVDWDIAKISDICKINPSKSEITQMDANTQVSFIRMENVGEDARGILTSEERKLGDVINHGYTYFKEGDLLFAKITPCMENGKIALAKNLKSGIGFGSTEFHVLRPEPAKVSPRFLFDWISRTTFREFASRHFRGTAGQQRVQKDFFNTAHIPLPPLEEQRKVAEILSAVDVVVAKMRAVIEGTIRLKDGLVQSLLAQGVAHRKFKKTLIGSIPEGWAVEKLKTVCISSAFGPRFSSSHYDPKGNVSTLRTTDIDDDGKINYETMPTAMLDLEDFKGHLLHPGDLVVTRSGTCGIAAVFSGHHLPVLPGAFLIRFRFSDKVDPQFLRLYFNCPIGRDRVLALAAGGVQKNLNGVSLLNLHIPLPPRSEQDQIAYQIMEIERSLQAERHYHAKFESLKKALANFLLTGKMRV